jgi:hypothetical protein
MLCSVCGKTHKIFSLKNVFYHFNGFAHENFYLKDFFFVGADWSQDGEICGVL